METLGANGMTVPEELQRQSKRITDQLQRLGIMLDKVSSHLEDMSGMMRSYSPELVTQINNLRTYVESYKKKAIKIYSDVADSLSKYAINLSNNLDSLTGSVKEIGNAIQGL